MEYGFLDENMAMKDIKFLDGDRRIGSSELDDLIRQAERNYGRDNSLLFILPYIKSIYSPEYRETRSNGTEVYSLGGKVVEVKPGEAIDEFGRVVNLRQLRKVASSVMISPIRLDSRIDFDGGKYKELNFFPINNRISEEDPFALFRNLENINYF